MVGIEAEGDRSNRDCGLNLTPPPLHMPDDPETYLAVLKATYDYEPDPGADDELAVKEDQVLFLVERVDDELSVHSLLHFLSNFQSFSTVGGRSSRNRRTTLLLVWSPLHTSNKCGTGLSCFPFIITYHSAWQHEHTTVVKALYDYDATNPGELTIKEDEILYVYDKDDAWLLVHSQKPGGRVGFVPETYVEEVRPILHSFVLNVC